MRREQRNGRAVRERPVDVRQREANRTLGDLLDAHPAECVAVLADVAAVLQKLDGVDDVISRHRLAVLPRRVVADVERPDFAVALGPERCSEIRDDRPRLVVAGEAAEGQSRDVLVDIGRGDDRIEELRDTRNTLDIRAADRRIARSGALVDDDRYHTCYDQKAEEGDDDELVAPGHSPVDAARAPTSEITTNATDGRVVS